MFFKCPFAILVAVVCLDKYLLNPVAKVLKLVRRFLSGESQVIQNCVCMNNKWDLEASYD